MPAHVWGCPTTAMWVYRVGLEKAKRMMFAEDKITGLEAEEMGLILSALPEVELDDAVEEIAARMTSVPINQLAIQKLLLNQAIEQTGIMQMQRISTIFDGISRHFLEGVNFKAWAEIEGWKTAVKERAMGTFDWTLKTLLPGRNR